MHTPSKINPSFNHIAPSIHIRSGSEPSSETDSERTLNPCDPTLILLFTWTSAVHSHIAKYTSHYTQLYPSSTIMVITTSANDLLYRSHSQKQRRLIPAITNLISRSISSNILVHCFSEGGSHKACVFAKTYLQATGTRLPISALCLDSTPGTLQPSEIPKMWRTAGSKSLPAKIARPAIEGVCIASYHTKSKHLFAEARRAFDDNSLWDITVPRCYFYSEADHLIGSEGILEHARQARKQGTPVTVVRFISSGHCAHVREDADKYWSGVQKTWDASVAPTHDGTGMKLGAIISMDGGVVDFMEMKLE